MDSFFRRAWNGTPIKEDVVEAGGVILAGDIGNQNCEFRIHRWQIESAWIFVLVRDQGIQTETRRLQLRLNMSW